MTWLGEPPKPRGAVGRSGNARTAILLLGAAIVASGGLWMVARPGEIAFLPPPPDPGLANRPSMSVGSPAAWVTNDDYPPDAMRRGEQGTVGVAFVVDARGHVRDCAIERSSGSPILDTTTCTLIEQRARYTPARDGTGRAAESRKTLRFRWVLAE